MGIIDNQINVLRDLQHLDNVVTVSTAAELKTQLEDSTAKTVVFSSGITLTEDITGHANNTLMKLGSGLISGAYMLTINGGMAGDMTSQWFDSNVTVVLPQGTDKIVNWWGTNAAAAQAAINCWETSGGIIKWIGAHTWSTNVSAIFTTTSTVDKVMDFSGATITSGLSSGHLLTIDAQALVRNLRIQGGQFIGNQSEDGVLKLDGGDSGSSEYLYGWSIVDTEIQAFTGEGITITENAFEGELRNTRVSAHSTNTTGSCIKLDDGVNGVVSSIQIYNAATRYGKHGILTVTPTQDVNIYGGTFLLAQEEGIKLVNSLGNGVFGAHLENNWQSVSAVADGGAGLTMIGSGVISGVKATGSGYQKYAVKATVADNKVINIIGGEKASTVDMYALAHSAADGVINIMSGNTVETTSGSDVVIRRQGLHYQNFDLFSSSGTGEDNLNSHTVAADTVPRGASLEVKAHGYFTNANDNKRIKLHLTSQDLNTGGKWEASGSGTSEYYFVLTDDSDPSVPEYTAIYDDGTELTSGTMGSLSAGEWDYGDNDSLGFSTIYVRATDSTDPDNSTMTGGSYYTVFGLANVTGDWRFEGDVIMTGDQAGTLMFETVESGTSTANVDRTQLKIDPTKDYVVKFTGECVNASDVVSQNGFILIYN